jgi:hypothetical protein
MASTTLFDVHAATEMTRETFFRKDKLPVEIAKPVLQAKGDLPQDGQA